MSAAVNTSTQHGTEVRTHQQIYTRGNIASHSKHPIPLNPTHEAKLIMHKCSAPTPKLIAINKAVKYRAAQGCHPHQKLTSDGSTASTQTNAHSPIGKRLPTSQHSSTTPTAVGHQYTAHLHHKDSIIYIPLRTSMGYYITYILYSSDKPIQITNPPPYVLHHTKPR